MSNTIEKALQRQKEQAEKSTPAVPDEKSLDTTIEETSLDSTDTVNSEVAHPVDKTIENKVESTVENTDENDALVETSSAQEQNTPTDKKRFVVDLEDLDQKGFITAHSARSQINEEYREIKRKLLANAFGALSGTLNNSNILMVTSARPSEGKTFTAVNLAMSIAAEQDKRVLLVDADVLKPNVLKTLGLNERAGLIEYLLGEVSELGKVMYSTNIDKLTIIPAGRSHHLSTELLASKVMHDTINEFSNRYPDRVVIIDTPPIIGINESAILANFAGQAVVVVEEGKSKLLDLQRSVERLNPEMAIGFVVNKSLNVSESVGYYGYHYYGYGKEK